MDPTTRKFLTLLNKKLIVLIKKTTELTKIDKEEELPPEFRGILLDIHIMEKVIDMYILFEMKNREELKLLKTKIFSIHIYVKSLIG